MWQRIETYGKQSWNADKDWPTYDDHDGCYGGMPISLIKIYNRFEREIKNALNGTNELEPQPVSYTHLDVYKRQHVHCPE